MVVHSEEVGFRVHREAGVATVTFDRPHKKNALTPAMFDALAVCFDEVAANTEDRVLVLAGAGGAFCSGADLTGSGDVAERLGGGPSAMTPWLRWVTEAARSLHAIAKPTLAAVGGVAAGGGCNLALGCDLVFAGTSARFIQVFVDRGLALDYGGSWLLPRHVGLQRAKDLAFRGRPVDAAEALSLGLVLEVVPDDALADHVEAYARELAAKPPIALGRIKRALDRATSQSFDEAWEQEAADQATCMTSQDFREAMAAWIQKREGHYEGR